MYNAYNFSHRRHTGIIFLQKYNHFQPPDVAEFYHGGRNFQLSHIAQYEMYTLFFTALTLRHAYISTNNVQKKISQFNGAIVLKTTE